MTRYQSNDANDEFALCIIHSTAALQITVTRPKRVNKSQEKCIYICTSDGSAHRLIEIHIIICEKDSFILYMKEHFIQYIIITGVEPHMNLKNEHR
jgi:hypothetical protein